MAILKGIFPIEEFKSYKTPFYYYDMSLLRDTLSEIKSCLEDNYRMHYAVKANFNPVILKEIASYGFGADCVSGGEIQAALDAGFRSSDIVFAGAGKSDWEIELGLGQGIGRFNVESVAELKVISEIASCMGRRAKISLRVNPDVGAHTHANITTGLAENKFGINYEQLEDAIKTAFSLPSIEYCGLHFHIGSQITDMSDFIALCNRINDLSATLSRHGLPVGDINVGGGLGINYKHPNHLPKAEFKAYFTVFKEHLDLSRGQLLHFELGRSIVAPCGSLISKVLYVKEGTVKKFTILDAGMTDLIRPAMYHAYHRIENISALEGNEEIDRYDVVGPICESSDVFAKDVDMDVCKRGDLIAIRSAGAYGEAMASCYNCRELPKAYFSK